jgi:hypothetical protein
MRMLRGNWIPWVFGLAVVTGCGGSSSGADPTEDGGGEVDGGTGADMAPAYPAWNASSPAICGQPAYAWQPAASVGSVLESSRNLLGVNTFVISTLQAVAFLGAQLNVQRSPTYSTHTASIRYQTQDRGKLVDATAMVTWPQRSSRCFCSCTLRSATPTSARRLARKGI